MENRTSHRALSLIVGLSSFSACGSYSGIGGSGGGGHNYVMAEKDASSEQIRAHVTTNYDSVTDTANFRVRFEIPAKIVPATNQSVSIRLQEGHSVKVDELPMNYIEHSQLILDSSKSDIVDGEYNLKINHPDLAKTFAIGWTKADGRHSIHSVSVPTTADFSLASILAENAK